MSQSLSREAARRLLRISEKMLKGWEQQGLVQRYDVYGFRELLALRTLIKLRANRLPPQQIRRTIQALIKSLRGVKDPLTELTLYADGKRIRVELDGKPMEAESGQWVLNFKEAELNRLLQFQAPDNKRDQRREAEHWFQRGLDLESAGAPANEVVEAYMKAVEHDPHSAGALVNLGTIYFNARNFTLAERFYKQATEVDPTYALAHFDLANLFDELGDRQRALEHYLAALKIAPAYADAHYNVALLYQGDNQPMNAVSHWMAYVKLDPASQWATIARRELAKLRDATIVRGSRG